MMSRWLIASVLLGACSMALAADAPTRVAVYDDAGAGAGSAEAVVNVLAEEPSKYRSEKVTAQDVRDGKLKGCDIVCFPGGTGGGQGKALEETGRENVRAFVKAGGGYVGFCAGAYLATDDYSWSIGLLKAKVVDKAHWARGRGVVELGATARGKELLGLPDEPAKVNYHQGPLLELKADPDKRCELLATFKNEVRRDTTPEGVMRGTGAIIAGTFGTGRVVAISPHPEKTDSQHGMVLKAFAWVGKR